MELRTIPELLALPASQAIEAKLLASKENTMRPCNKKIFFLKK